MYVMNHIVFNSKMFYGFIFQVLIIISSGQLKNMTGLHTEKCQRQIYLFYKSGLHKMSD